MEQAEVNTTWTARLSEESLGLRIFPGGDQDVRWSRR